MTKFVKALVISGYAFLLIQYLRITLRPVKEEIDIKYITRSPSEIKILETRYKKYRRNFTAFLNTYQKPKRFKTDYKYILKYTTGFAQYATLLAKNGQRPFIDNNCTYNNCYLTNQRHLLKDYRDYDAILFDVENSWDGPLIIRDSYQKFVFMASESSASFPLCDSIYDHYYNLTWTYKVDSDIRWSYMYIFDMQGNMVGPKTNMTWIEPMKSTPIEIKKKIGGKSKAAAWFVSHCNTISGRQNISRTIEKELKKYNLTVDIYGWCGRMTCPQSRMDECVGLLESDYYFYFAFENSLCEDFVTQNVLYPLQNYAVPIVYGGADYNRFLPPGSYINARELNAKQIAAEMNKAIKHPSVYENYFRWHNHYKYVKAPPLPGLCELCRILNEEADKRYVYKEFREWWNPDYYSLCTKGVGRFLIAKPDNFGVMEVNDLRGKKYIRDM